MGLNNSDFQGTLEGAAQQAPPASAYDNSNTASSAAVSPTAAPAGAPTAATPAPAPSSAGGAGATSTPNAGGGEGNIGSKMLHGILGALGGTDEVSYRRASDQDVQQGLAKNPGDLITTRQPKTSGQQWKTIIAGALSGAAEASKVKPGPGVKERAAGAGLDAGMKMVQGQDALKREHADEDFGAQQKALAQRASIAKLNQDLAESSWRLTREKADFQVANLGMMTNARNLVMGDPSNGNEDFGTYPSFKDFLDKHHQNGAAIGRMNATGELRAFPVFDNDGKLSGVQVFKVNPAWGAQKNAQEVKIDFGPKLKADGTADHNIQTIPVGGMSNADIITAQQAGAKQWTDYIEKDAKAKKDAAEAKNAGQVTPALKFTQQQETAREELKQKHEDARAAKKFTENKTAVYAFDPTTNRTVLSNQSEASEKGFAGVRKVTQKDIASDMHDTRVLNDVATKANNVASTAAAMDDRSWGQAVIAAKELADNKNTTVQNLFKSGALKHATPQAKAYIIAVQNLRESSMGLQKVLTGTARTNETQLNALVNTLPGLEPDSKTVKQKLANFGQNITMLRQGIPDLPGIQSVQLSPDITNLAPGSAAPKSPTANTPPPAGATHTAPGSDGKTHYTNDKGEDLGVVPNA